MSRFQQQLDFCSFSPSDILTRLEHLTGLVYLQDHHVPVIAFLPQTFLLSKQTGLHQFQQVAFNQYQSTIKPTCLLDFMNFQTDLETPCNPTGFDGGYIGFFSYDYGAAQSIQLNMHPQPNFYLGQYHSFLKYQDGVWVFHSDDQDAAMLYRYLCTCLQHPATIPTLSLLTPCAPRWSKQQYLNAFQQVQDYIRAGDCYQINLTQEFTAPAQGALLSRAKDLWQLTHAPYAGYLKIDDFELISCSPELFIDFQTKRKIKTRPIKGTMPRFADAQQDQQSKERLMQSEKDRAENVMIVDLLRNDLSLYAETGSVTTTKLFEIESFNQVHHMVSEITATLKDDIHPMQMLLSALPGGSITGAPKIRAMQIIEELEQQPRGAYCGSLGYFNFDGTGCWNILIRSIQKYQNQLSMWAGGGITIASDAEAEYQECFDKISAMLNLINTPQHSNQA